LDINKINELMDRWVDAPLDNDTTWKPLPNDYPDWEPLNEKWEPIEQIHQQRKGDAINVLTEECRIKLRDWWDGKNLPLTNCGCGAHSDSSGHGHFHCYPLPIKNYRFWNNWRAMHPAQRHHWYCTGIRNAADHYSWTRYPGGSFKQLAATLQSAMRIANQNLAAVVCFKIIDWGGLLKGPLRSINTIDWISNSENIIQDVSSATGSLCPQSSTVLNTVFGHGIPMNAASTKIFAAAAMDFSLGLDTPQQDVIIFDGRVSTALGLFVRRLMYPNPVPEGLRFPRDHNNPLRNASMPGHVTFPSMNDAVNTPDIRAEYARTAARCVQDALGIYMPSTEFVQAEKALFMIGYNVVKLCCNCPRPQP